MSANIAFGTQFSWNGNHVADLTKINGVEVTAKTIDVTTHDSVGGYTQEIPGLKTAGDISIEGNAMVTDTLGQMAMLADFEARALRTALITFPPETGASWSVPGYVTGIKFGDAAVDGVIPFTATVKPFGKPTFSVATATGLTTPFFALSNSAVIIPTPSAAVFTYIASVLTAIASLTITPTATAQTIKINGNVVASGVPSSAITLGAAGSITPVTIEVSSASAAAKIYTIYISRP